MKIYIEKNYEQMSKKAAHFLLEQLTENPASTLGLATGDTTLKLYKLLIAAYEQKRVSFERVKTINLDEYIGLPREHPNSYYYYMMENLYRHINIPSENTYIPNGMAKDLKKECVQFEQTIETLGGIDLQVLGIGVNGHIGFNEPGTPIDSTTHVVRLGEDTRKSNSRFFPSVDDVPKEALTIGIKTIMKSRQVLLLANGVKKAQAIQRLIEGPVHPESPASILQLHPNAIIIIDEEAASLLQKRETNE